MNQARTRVDLQSHDHSAFERGSGRFREVLWYLVKMAFFLSAFPFPSRLKVFLLRSFGARMGRGVVLRPRVAIQMPWKLRVGDHCWIGEEVFILNFDTVSIGNNVCLSQRAFICGGNHDFRNPGMPFRPSAVTIEDGVWVGACAFVGPGVTLGVDSVVAAASAITQNTGPGEVFKGNPAVFAGKRWTT